MPEDPSFFGDPEVDAALRGGPAIVVVAKQPPPPVVPPAEIPPWAPVIVPEIPSWAPQSVVYVAEGEPTVTLAQQPPKLQIVLENQDGVRPVHQTFQGAWVDPDIDPWAGQDNSPPTGEKATMTRLGG